MLIASGSMRRGQFSGQPSPGEPMKIYMLMVLIGTIAAMSHLDFKRKSPGRGA
jgi:hypothetical protein